MARRPKVATPEQLAALDAMTAWTPPPVRHRHGPECSWPVPSRLYRRLPEYVRPSEQPGLHQRSARPEDLTEEAIKAWVAEAPERAGMSIRLARALCYIDQFKPRGEHA